MKVLVATTVMPFAEGGATLLVDGLEAALRSYGHEVEVFSFPFDPSYTAMLDQSLGLRLLDVAQAADRLIAIRPPSYVLRHPSKVVWFIHHHRGAYDLWGTAYQDLPDTPESRGWRSALHSVDTVALREARQVYCNSQVTAERLSRFNRITAQVLYPPVLNPEQFRCYEYGDTLVYISRLVRHKRQHVAIEALALTNAPVKLVIAGPPEQPGYLEELQALVDRLGLSDRVTLLAEWITDRQKVDLFARCLAAVYIPFDEDSYGYPSLEAHHSRKAVLTTLDAGGVLELITHEENGLVCAPEPAPLAEAMDRLYSDRSQARSWGEAGLARLGRLQIGWNHVVEALLA